MPRTLLRPLLLGLAALAVAGCGSEGLDIPADATEQERLGAVLFDQRCSACHTFAPAGSQGSAVNVNQREYKDGPNFNERVEEYDQVLYAIRNGGFSSGPMPQNIVVGEEAEAVAAFVAKYSGNNVARNEQPGEAPPAGSGGEAP
jgi:mono/diheme cytochrome c family protein